MATFSSVHDTTDHTGIPGVGGGGSTELAYVERTSNLTVTGTSEGTGNEIVSAGAVVFDGSTRVCIEFFAAEVSCATGTVMIFDLSDGGTEIGRMGAAAGDDADQRQTVLLRRFLTPSAASHTYAIQVWEASGSGSIEAGSGGTGAFMPAYIRITTA